MILSKYGLVKTKLPSWKKKRTLLPNTTKLPNSTWPRKNLTKLLKSLGYATKFCLKSRLIYPHSA